MQPTSASPSDSALRLAVDVRTLPWMRPLAIDYAFDFEKLSSFFSGNPADPSAWTDAIRRAQRHARPRAAIVQVLEGQQARRGSPAEARAVYPGR